jgi:hypothetical protein
VGWTERNLEGLELPVVSEWGHVWDSHIITFHPLGNRLRECIITRDDMATVIFGRDTRGSYLEELVKRRMETACT